jgi:hypothetical protein
LEYMQPFVPDRIDQHVLMVNPEAQRQKAASNYHGKSFCPISLPAIRMATFLIYGSA